MGNIKKQYSPLGGEVIRYEVADKYNNILAVWTKINPEEQVVTYDKRSFGVPSTLGALGSEELDRDILALNIVKKLFLNGITLDNQGEVVKAEYQEKMQQERQNKWEKIKSESVNITNVPGYVIDDKGMRMKGMISIDFESLDTKMNPNSGIIDTSVYGKSVSLKYTDEKGKEKRKSFKSKTGVQFCIQTDIGDECYLGLRAIGNTLNAIGTNPLSLDFSSYYKIIYDNAGHLLVKNPVEENYVIKFPHNDKGLLVKRSENKMNKAFDEYSKCDKINMEDYDLKDVESLKKIISDYIKECK